MDVVTGAFSFTGKYIARRLLALGREVKTLTGHPDREQPFGSAIMPLPLQFDDPAALRECLAGAETLYNTYWIRLEHGRKTFAGAVENTGRLIEAARQAGVRRIVHISIAHANEDSPFPYFGAKGEAERIVRESGLSCAILRPTVLFGTEGILFNNIAWMLRKFPVFAIPGKGDYQLQPIHVDDLAELAVAVGQEQPSLVLDAGGPETFTFDELVRLMASQTGSHARLLHLAPDRVMKLIRMVGGLVGDVVLTPAEIDGLMQDMLAFSGTPVGYTRFSGWLGQHAAELGLSYISEMARHYR